MSLFLSVSNKSTVFVFFFSKSTVFKTLCQPNKNTLGSVPPICGHWPKIYNAQRNSDLLDCAYTSIELRVSY